MAAKDRKEETKRSKHRCRSRKRKDETQACRINLEQSAKKNLGEHTESRATIECDKGNKSDAMNFNKKFFAELKSIIKHKDVQGLTHFLDSNPISADNLARAEVVAFKAKSWKCFWCLLSHQKADVNRPLPDEHKCTLLHFAAFEGNPRTVKKLLGKGARTNVVNSFGETPYGAAESGSTRSKRERRTVHQRRQDYDKVLNMLKEADPQSAVYKNRSQPRSVPQQSSNQERHEYRKQKNHGSHAHVPIDMRPGHCQCSADSHRDTHFRQCATMRQDHHNRADESAMKSETFFQTPFFDQDFGNKFPEMPSMENFFSETFPSSLGADGVSAPRHGNVHPSDSNSSVDWFKQQPMPESQSLFSSAQRPCTRGFCQSNCDLRHPQSKQQFQHLPPRSKQAAQSHQKRYQEPILTSSITFCKGEKVWFVKRSPRCIAVVTNVDTAADPDVKTYGIRVEGDPTVRDVLASSLRKLK